ncbi:MAG: DEAD/DEAH box helicase [Acidimicrobiales bacterium]
MLEAYDFQLDAFQLRAIDALDAGRSVLVAAPTGSGKTVVAEYAVALALREGQKAFYTTPIKALSNQKYGDLVRRHGADRVGLLTGDNVINGDAPIVVMTTEVLRNMVYAAAPALEGLRFVVLDEVHYLQDAYRGPVWEEVILHLSTTVRLVCLSATVSNAEELADWIATVRGPTEVVIETARPVELVNLYCVGDRSSPELHLLPTLVEAGRHIDDAHDGPAVRRRLVPNPEANRLDAESLKTSRPRDRGRRRFFTPRRVELVERLTQEELLPAIVFIFSRAACDDAVKACIDMGVRLTTSDERPRIREVAERHVEALSDADLDVLGYDAWLTGLEMGVGAHHAGLVPPFKEAVEELFTAGLAKVVFATETLALGINMPARSVVIAEQTKFDGESRRPLLPNEYAQLTGRAGRRGLDPVGYAVVLWSPFVPFDQVATLASSRSFKLTSAFRPTYNMAANLVRRYEPADAHHLLNLSFAQYQADRSVVRLEARIDKRSAELNALVDEARCDRGDSDAYAALVDARDLAERHAGSDGAENAAEAAVVVHPVHRCPDGERHLRAVARAARAKADVKELRRSVKGRTESLARRFDRVLRVLEAWGHLDGWDLTDKGARLGSLYHEADLLIAECLDTGLLDDLDPAAMAGLCSTFTFEHRSSAPAPTPWFPSARVRGRYESIVQVARELNADEHEAGLPLTRRPDPGFVALAHAWAAGENLDEVLADEDLSGGDFVRNVKQLIDLLRQIADAAAGPETTRSARQAAEALFRGVVAASSAVSTDRP